MLAGILARLAASAPEPRDRDELAIRLGLVAEGARCNLATQQQVVEFTSHRPRAPAAAVVALPNTGAAPAHALLPLVALLLLTRVVRRRQRR